MATDTSDALENLENELVTMARRLRGLQRTLSDEAHPDLEPAQYALLNHVEELAPVRMADLVAALEVDKGPVSRACARLEEEGLLKRAADKSDARATLLTLTAGRQAQAGGGPEEAAQGDRGPAEGLVAGAGEDLRHPGVEVQQAGRLS